MADESRTLQLKRFSTFSDAQDYVGSKGEVAFLDSGDHRYPTLVAYTGEDEGATIIGKMRFTHNLIFYVDASSGEDSIVEGRGFIADKPWKTLPFAWAYIAKNVEVYAPTITIHLAPGIYEWDYSIGDLPCFHQLIIDGGNKSASTPVCIKEGAYHEETVAVAMRGGCEYIFRNIKFISTLTDTYRVVCTYNSVYADFYNCTFEQTGVNSKGNCICLGVSDASHVRLLGSVEFATKQMTELSKAITCISLYTNGYVHVTNGCTFKFTGFDNAHDGCDVFAVFQPYSTVFIDYPTGTLVPYSGNTGAMTLLWKTTVSYPVPRAISFYWKDVTHTPSNALSEVFTSAATVALASVDDSPMSGESDPAYDRLMQQFAELDEEYRRVGILSDENA